MVEIAKIRQMTPSLAPRVLPKRSFQLNFMNSLYDIHYFFTFRLVHRSPRRRKLLESADGRVGLNKTVQRSGRRAMTESSSHIRDDDTGTIHVMLQPWPGF